MCRKLTHLISFLLLLSLATNVFADLISDPSIVVYYSFDEISDIVVDQSGNGHDGVVNGDVTAYPDGKLNGAAKFEGRGGPSGRSFLDLDGANFPVEENPTSAMTISAWAKCENTGDHQTLFNARASDSTWVIHPELRSNGEFRWLLRAAGGSTIFDIRAGTITWDQWVHYAGTYDKATAKAILYVDGEVIHEENVSNPQDIVGDWQMGARVGYDIDDARAFTGLMDIFCMFRRALSQGEITRAMQGEAYPYAFSPDPADGAIIEQTWATVSWSAGDSAVSHDVYFSDSFDYVNEGAGDAFQGNQILTYLVVGFPGFPFPDGLVPGTTYYWRIDEVNEADPNSPWRGNVWSFSVAPKTAYHPDPADGAEFVDLAVTLSWTAGFGAKLHTVYLGDDFDEVSNATGGSPQGSTSYTPDQLESETVYYWRVDEFDGLATYKGDIWSFTTPGAVANPQPAYGATDVGMNAILSWTPADSAASHELYFGTDKQVVRTADAGSPEYAGSKALGAESHDPELLEPDTTYYWRVDEVDAQGNTAKGPLWIFTTGTFLLVDDFEGYTDDDAAGEAIWQTWVDGFGVADNGAQVGYLVPPYAEQTTVHGGSQSMPLLYVNEAGVLNSEGSLTLTAPRDWMLAGVAELSLWYRGLSDNAADPLYVAVSNASGAPAVVANDDTAAATIIEWAEWRIPLQDIADQGINLGNVDKIAIGVGSKGGASVGGSGTVYIDDIRLYQP